MVDRHLLRLCGLGLMTCQFFDLWNYYSEDLSREEMNELAEEADRDLLEEEGFVLG